MWRCPRCVAHVKDDLTVCPTCRMQAPERTTETLAVDGSDLDDLFPEKTPAVESLIPDLTARELETKEGHQIHGAFLIGFLGSVVCVVINTTNRATSFTDYFFLVPLGLLLGSVFGVAIGLVVMISRVQFAVLFRAVLSVFRPSPPGMREVLNSLSDEDEKEEDYARWDFRSTAEEDAAIDLPANNSAACDDSTLPPPSSPPSTTSLQNKEPPDAILLSP